MEDKSKLVKYAATLGLYMGVYWALKYLCVIFGGKIEALGTLYMAMTAVVPFMGYRFTMIYRAQLGNDRSFSFFHGWQFGVFLYTFAAIIVSLSHFYYYRNILGAEGISEVMRQSLSVLSEAKIDSRIVEQARQIVPTPFQMTIQGILNNILAGVVFSIPVALLTKKRNTNPNT